MPQIGIKDLLTRFSEVPIMRLYSAVRATKVLSAFLAILLCAPLVANAGNGKERDRHRHHRHQDGGYSSLDNRLPTRIAGLGTFAGGFSAVRDKGNGIYFHIEGRNDMRPVARVALPPAAKIIAVSPGEDAGGCEWEAGVCVIRP